jgi:hypothetical protein
MAKGAIGKQIVTNKIAEAFGADYIGEVDKKLYVWTVENGERIQIAISLTCPKVMVESGAAAAPVEVCDIGGGGFNWDDDAPASKPAPAEISVDEQKNIQNLMEQLGL